MDQPQIHYELYIRKVPGAPWVLEMASEQRGQVVEAAETMLAEGQVAAVRVTKETLDPETREFQSVAILSKGEVDGGRKKPLAENREPLCVTPQDLYSLHARERIGRLLEGWLARHKATPFELLHRADLVERLEAAGTELQHAVQKIAVPEAQARDISVHELIRSFQTLIERAINRVMVDARRNRFPALTPETFAAMVARAAAEPEPSYLLGGGVAGYLASADSWGEKVMRLLDLADAAPTDERPRSLAFHVLQPPLAEILESRAALAELLGANLDLGGQLAALTQIAAAEAVARLVAIEPQVAGAMPPLEGPARRLAGWLTQPPFAEARAAVGRRILSELTGPRRLRPASPKDEIDLLRALGMALTAAASQLLPLESVQEAFAARSSALVTADFVGALLGRDGSAREEAELLIWLCENVIGGANKRAAARYLATHVAALRFEKELRYGPDTPMTRLAALAKLQKAAARAGLDPAVIGPILERFGDIGGLIEADLKLTATLGRAQAPAAQRLTLLLKLATGEAAPDGPAAQRAKEAALKLLKSEAVRSELSAAPERMSEVRELIQACGLAA